MLNEEFFANRSLASQSVAKRITAALEHDLDKAPEAALIVSGGSTPKQCYELLANTQLAWDRVHILLSDERCVHPDHQASNEGMIRRSLVTHRAAKAKLVSVCDSDLPLVGNCDVLAEKMRALPKPYSAALLGIGEDGHFASLFPDFDRLDEGLDLDSKQSCMLVNTAASPHPRVTLTMPSILQSREVLLLFFGNEKRAMYERAKLGDCRYPLSRLLQQQHTPVRMFWAP